jgi:hypothetical protein
MEFIATARGNSFGGTIIGAIEPTAPCGQRQHQRHRRIQPDRHSPDIAPIEPISHHARHRRHQKHRHKLDKSQHAQHKRGLRNAHTIGTARQIIKLIADDNDHPARRQPRPETGHPKQSIIADMQGGCWISHRAYVAGARRIAKSGIFIGISARAAASH